MAEGLLLVRLLERQPDGTVVGESERACHLVPLPNTVTVPDFLVAHCGLRIGPGAGEVLSVVVGMPCEVCMARSSLPVFGVLSGLRGQLEAASTSVTTGRGNEWSGRSEGG